MYPFLIIKPKVKVPEMLSKQALEVKSTHSDPLN